MATTYEVRQLVRTAKGNRLETIAETTIPRAPRAGYETFCHDYPDKYFELVMVERTEECLMHNGKPDLPPDQSGSR